MSLPIPAVYRVTAVLTDNWYRANQTGWQLTLKAAEARGARLAEIIRDRFLTLRDEVAREAFDRREDICVVAWERAQRMAAERRGEASVQGQIQPVLDLLTPHVPEITCLPHPFVAAGGKSGSCR